MADTSFISSEISCDLILNAQKYFQNTVLTRTLLNIQNLLTRRGVAFSNILALIDVSNVSIYLSLWHQNYLASMFPIGFYRLVTSRLEAYSQ